MTIARFMIPDILTPGQYYDRVHRDDHETQAVKRLMLAVLSDAVRCFLAYAAARDRTGRLRFAEAEAWILDHKPEGPFAFVTICESLGIEPNCLREAFANSVCCTPMVVSQADWAGDRRPTVRGQQSRRSIHGTDDVRPIRLESKLDR
jgi:hypothetical protein